jgi:hypothetical protein
MTFKEGPCRLRWKCADEAVVRMREVHREIVRLALPAADDGQRLTEVRLRLPGRMHQRDEHLPAALGRQAQVVFHDRVAARKPMFVPEPIEDPLRSVTLLGRPRLVLFENRRRSLPATAPTWAASPVAVADSPAAQHRPASSESSCERGRNSRATARWLRPFTRTARRTRPYSSTLNIPRCPTSQPTKATTCRTSLRLSWTLFTATMRRSRGDLWSILLRRSQFVGVPNEPFHFPSNGLATNLSTGSSTKI